MRNTREDPPTLAKVNISTGAVTPDSNGDGLIVGNHFHWYNPNTSGPNCSITCPTDPKLAWFSPNPSSVPAISNNVAPCQAFFKRSPACTLGSAPFRSR